MLILLVASRSSSRSSVAVASSTRPTRHFSNPLVRAGFFECARQGALTRQCLLMKIDESLLLARQGEELAERQLRYREVYVGRKPMAKHWPDEQELHTRRSGWMRRRRSLKSKTCPESVSVYAAGISVKVSAHYPGRSLNMPKATGAVRHRDVLREVSRDHSSQCRSLVKDRTEERQRGTQP